jgi:hypothetical protein
MECGELSRDSLSQASGYSSNRLLNLAKSSSDSASALNVGSIFKATIASSSMIFFNELRTVLRRCENAWVALVQNLSALCDGFIYTGRNPNQAAICKP